MRPRYSPHHPREVRRQSFVHYGENYFQNFSSVARKVLYKYASTPEEQLAGTEPYDIWADIAIQLDVGNADNLVDLGTGEADFYHTIRRANFNGKFVGVDNHDGLEAVEHMVKGQFPDANVEFIRADALDLKDVIADSSTSRVTANFIIYHVDYPPRLISEMIRIGQPGALGAIAGRGTDNQIELWQFARETAFHNDFAFPKEYDPEQKQRRSARTEDISFYSHFPIEVMFTQLRRTPGLRVMAEVPQWGRLYIPDTSTGWNETAWAASSLLTHTINLQTGEQATEDDIDRMRRWMNANIYPKFSQSAQYNQLNDKLPGPYFYLTVHQGFSKFKIVK